MTNGNEPAYPVPEISDGLTKREYFAAMAMQGLISTIGTGHDVTHYEELSKDAVNTADALINALNQNQ